MTDALDLDALKALEKAGSPAPWDDAFKGMVYGKQWKENRDFAKALRNAAPALIAAAEERNALRAALEQIEHMRHNCRSADHFECAELFSKCLDISRAALSAIRKAKEPTI